MDSFFFLLTIHLGKKLLGHMETVWVLRNCQTTFKVATMEALPSLCPLQHVLSAFHYSHPSGWEVVFHCGFEL